MIRRDDENNKPIAILTRFLRGGALIAMVETEQSIEYQQGGRDEKSERPSAI